MLRPSPTPTSCQNQSLAIELEKIFRANSNFPTELEQKIVIFVQNAEKQWQKQLEKVEKNKNIFFVFN